MSDPGAAGLLGVIGGRLVAAPGVLDVRPVVAVESHEITALRVVTRDGVYVVAVAPA